ncbi:hypothetical protein [Bacillus tropicus]|uniref:hypothetical protein n=1 Tax=Bacillus tropicus TaxID=2026188 RepID=UPI0011A85805|nr:hypothetical protein [Bacillus tropicus]
MRPVLVCNIHKLRGKSILYSFLYDKGVLVTQTAAPLEAKPLARKLREIVWSNCTDLPAFDVHTNTEAVYKACISEPDILGHYKTEEETSETKRYHEDEVVQTALIDVYEIKDHNEKQVPKWRKKLIGMLQKCIRLLEGSTEANAKGAIKDEVGTIR